MPVLNHLLRLLIGRDCRQLSQRHRQRATLPADRHEHLVSALLFSCEADDRDCIADAQGGSRALHRTAGTERNLQRALKVGVPAQRLFLAATDGLVDLLIQLVRKISVKAEKKVEQILFADFKRVSGKPQLLYYVAAAALEHPTDRVCDVLYPAVGGEQTLHDLLRESTSTARTYRSQVHTVMRASYNHHYRRTLPVLLQALQFHSTNRPIARSSMRSGYSATPPRAASLGMMSRSLSPSTG